MGDRVATELLEQRLRQHEGHGGLGDHRGGGHRADVRALLEGLRRLLGGDIDRITVSKAKETLRNAKLDDGVTIRHCAFADLEAPDRKGMLILNPPYGERMNERGIAAASAEEDINALYKMIGDTLKHRWAGWTAWVLTSNLDAAKHIKLTPKPKIQLFNGALDCRFLRYELYEGSRRLSPLPTKNE